MFSIRAVVLHACLRRIVATVLLVVLLLAFVARRQSGVEGGLAAARGGRSLGVVLIRTGTPHSEFRWLYAHILACVAGDCVSAGGMAWANAAG